MPDKLKNIERALRFPLKDVKRFIKDFHSEMKKGLGGSKSSLKMLPTYAGRPTGKERGEFLALDLGGTNFRVGLLELRGSRKIKSPLTEKFVLQKRHITKTGEIFFTFLADSIKKFMIKHKIDTKEKHNMGFTFSFPIKKTSISTGILASWTKGFTVKNVEGKDVVRLLNRALQRKGITDTRIAAIVNDTVSTLIARSYEDPNCDVGVILGTGTNACYYERENIINIEWGNFNRAMQTKYDKRLDENSQNPGEQILEKMVSGMYLGKLAGLILKDIGYPIRSPEGFKTEYISEIESGKNGRSFHEKLLKKVCTAISTRAARLAGAAIASVVTKMDFDLSRKHTIAIDGSLYEKHPRFAKRIRSTLGDIFGKKSKNIKLKLTKDASIRGAAIVAATAR